MPLPNGGQSRLESSEYKEVAPNNRGSVFEDGISWGVIAFLD